MSGLRIVKPAVSYTLDEAAIATGLGVNMIRDAGDRGDIPLHWAGSRRLHLAADLAAWVESLPSERIR